MKKKVFCILTIIFIVILLIILSQINNKNFKSGNNIINKTTEQIINNVLNMRSYREKLM